MRVIVILATLLCVVCSSASYARSKHGHNNYRPEPGNQVGCSDPIMRPCEGWLKFEPSSAARTAHRIGHQRTLPPGACRHLPASTASWPKGRGGVG
jgi:hypothetical protein